MPKQTTDGRVLRGEQTRQAILRRAADIASVEGLEGLSIGRLATALDVSKSGVFAHFGSKEELQLATIRVAAEVFAAHVATPGLEHPPGALRLWRLCDAWLDYAQAPVFPGGCFFCNASAEFDARPGRVRDALADSLRLWQQLLERTAADAQQLGELRDDVDVPQLTFELDAFARAANAVCLLGDDATAFARARRAIRARISAELTDPQLLPV
ncbi:MAG: TetR/AcrR family transcriptional regulator [Solirubrobacteraceae bacterium]|nr:TetR/AcrR family transcriptional regulator [Solirubrobacteraceae bacterium]